MDRVISLAPHVYCTTSWLVLNRVCRFLTYIHTPSWGGWRRLLGFQAAKVSSQGGKKGVDGEPGVSLVEFGSVVNGKERFDVCRIFLASLQLVSPLAARGLINRVSVWFTVGGAHRSPPLLLFPIQQAERS